MFELNKKDQSQAAGQPERKAPQLPAGGLGSSEDRPPTRSSGIAVIGRSITIDGDLRGEEDLRVEGDINGTIQLPNHSLTIGKEGRLKADAYAKAVTVDGEINGDLYGSECVSIRANARVVGNVVASSVTLEEGARFKGSIDMDPKSVEAALGDKRAATPAADAAKGERRGPSAAPKEKASERKPPKVEPAA